MREIGRNDPCPCGSGHKHKRCCLDAGRAALRVAARLEQRIIELGAKARHSARDVWVVDDEPLTRHCPHEPFGPLEGGSLLIARDLDTGGGHVALVGRPIAVDPDAVDDILMLLNRAPDQALCAALRWPEEREHTADGELVQQCTYRYELHDPDTAIAILRATGDVVEKPEALGYWEDDVVFHVTADPVAQITGPPDEPGVRWELCREDTEMPRLLGEVTVSPDDGELALSAPTSRRTERLLQALPAQLRSSLGAMTSEDIDAPDVLPRVRRDRLASLV